MRHQHPWIVEAHADLHPNQTGLSRVVFSEQVAKHLGIIVTWQVPRNTLGVVTHSSLIVELIT